MILGNDHDPAPTFFNENTQNSLKILTRIDLSKIYRKRKTGAKSLEQPVYKFMTDEQLQEAINEAKNKIDELIQMPPVVAIRQPIQRVLSRDPALQGLETSRFVFTDITFGLKNSERLIITREIDGTLKEADWETRDRMNQIYFPLNGKKLRTPLMFEDSYIEKLLNKKEYEFILNRACIQFEPNSSEYQKITSVTYQCIDKNNDFNLLRSTRHFGPFAFFLIWFKSIDNLLLDLIETSHIEEATVLIKLYANIHDIAIDGDNIALVENYIAEQSTKKGPLELVLQAYKEAEEERKALDTGLKSAHGLN